MSDKRSGKATKVAEEGAKKSGKGGAARRETPDGLSAMERAAVKERARELKAEARESKNRADGERAVLATIARMATPDRVLGERVHAIVTAHAPALLPKLWYGMPAYAHKDGKVVCFFQAAGKFATRYSSFAFTDAANLDDGAMWPTGFGLKGLTSEEEAKLGALLQRAMR